MVHKRNKVPRLVIEFYTKHMYKFEKKNYRRDFYFYTEYVTYGVFTRRDHRVVIIWIFINCCLRPSCISLLTVRSWYHIGCFCLPVFICSHIIRLTETLPHTAVTIAEAERTFIKSSRRLSPWCRPPTLPQAPPRIEYSWRSDRVTQVENKENNNMTTFLLLHELSRNCELSIKYDRVFLHTFRTLVVASKSVDTTWKDFDQL